MATNATTGTSATAPLDLSSMDIESALMAVQTQRANLLESQLKDQMAAVQARNNGIQDLNDLLSAVRGIRPSGDTTATADTGSATITMSNEQYVKVLHQDIARSQAELDANSGSTDMAKVAKVQMLRIKIGVLNANLKEAQAPGAPATKAVSLSLVLEANGFMSGTLSQAQFDQLIPTISSRIDGLNSTQQLDMLRLQSLTNKRNEAFDIMTNFIKKMQDGRSSIVGNMR